MEQEDCCFTIYADDTTPYVVANNRAEVTENLTITAQKLYTWFVNNQMKVNHNKYHLLLNTQEEPNIQIPNATIKCSKSKNCWALFLIINLNLTNILRTFAKKQAKS